MDFTSHQHVILLLFLLHQCLKVIHGFHFPMFQIVEERDSICGRNQFYSREFGRCQKCSACPPGSGVSSRCSSTRDTQCAACLPGHTYSAHYSHRSPCHACTKCQHRDHVTDCTVNADTTCGACEKGYYFYELRQQCAKCSYCHPELPGATERLPECDVPGMRADNQCLQLKHARAQKNEPPPMMRLAIPFFGFS